MKHFKSQAYCNICHSALTGFARKQGLQCVCECKFELATNSKLAKTPWAQDKN